MDRLFELFYFYQCAIGLFYYIIDAMFNCINSTKNKEPSCRMLGVEEEERKREPLLSTFHLYCTMLGVEEEEERATPLHISPLLYNARSRGRGK